MGSPAVSLIGRVMGIEYSSEDHQDVPLTGSPTSLEVLQCSGKYVKKDSVILKLRENGSNYRIVDTSGVKYFDILPTDLMDDSMKLVDTKGKDIACFRKERFGPGKRVHILVKNNGLWTKKSEGKVLSVATLDHGAGQPGPRHHGGGGRDAEGVPVHSGVKQGEAVEDRK